MDTSSHTVILVSVTTPIVPVELLSFHLIQLTRDVRHRPLDAWDDHCMNITRRRGVLPHSATNSHTYLKYFSQSQGSLPTLLPTHTSSTCTRWCTAKCTTQCKLHSRIEKVLATEVYTLHNLREAVPCATHTCNSTLYIMPTLAPPSTPPSHQPLPPHHPHTSPSLHTTLTTASVHRISLTVLDCIHPPVGELDDLIQGHKGGLQRPWKNPNMEDGIYRQRDPEGPSPPTPPLT